MHGGGRVSGAVGFAIAALLVAALAIPALADGAEAEWLRPPALEPGDTIELVAPAGAIQDAGAVAAYRATLEASGLRVRLDPALTSRRHHDRAGTDAERTAELNRALRDPEVRGVFAVRGGYGLTRILDQIDYGALRRDPKVITGYSDLTALHLACARQARVVTFHSPMAGAWLDAGAEGRTFAARSFRDMVLAPVAVFPWAVPLPAGGSLERVVGGRAEGRLCGGNLSLICATLGTPYAIEPAGRILFLEDVNEKPYRVDRMLSQLQLAGVLDAVAGVVAGRFTFDDDVPADAAAAEARIADILREYLGRSGKPAVLGFPVGHVADNATLPHGARVRLDADAGTLQILEAPCAPRRPGGMNR
jgi:muramoyltetrapeptide carboxypeptidase